MGRKYIVEVNDIPFIRGTEKLYECANIGGVVLEEDELKKLEEISLEHAIDIIHDEKWLEAHDREISEGVWRFAEKLIWEMCTNEAQDAGLLSIEDTDLKSILARNTYKQALDKYKYYQEQNANIKDNNAVSWERFLKAPSIFQVEHEVEMGVKCPKCGELIYRDNSIICTSNPPKIRYFCKNCEWVGYR